MFGKPERIVGFIMAVLRMDRSAGIKVAPFGSSRRCRLTVRPCPESKKCSAVSARQRHLERSGIAREDSVHQAECAVNEAEVVPARMELAGGFMPLSLPQSTPGDIRVEVRRGGSVITVSWPVQAASECATWLRTWLK